MLQLEEVTNLPHDDSHEFTPVAGKCYVCGFDERGHNANYGTTVTKSRPQ